jgi:hydrogenase maturation factor
MATLLLPEHTAPETVRGIFDQLLEACSGLGVTLIGGHTEVTYDLPRPIAMGAMLGEVPKQKVVLTSGAKPGDTIVLTKGIAIEGTAILAREAGDRLAQAGVARDTVDMAKNFLFAPGISVVRDAAIACETVSVHSMHDPTEGGLATGLLEMAKAANVGLAVDTDRIPVLPECRSICQALALDPMGLIGSGALLAGVAPQDAGRLIDALQREGIAACEIGTFTSPKEGLKLRSKQRIQELPVFERDELARFFGGGA